MIKPLLCALYLLVFIPVFAQDYQNKDKIIDYLGEERFNAIQSSNPSYLKYLDVRCSNGFKIIDYVDEKMNKMKVIHIVSFKEDCEEQKDGSCKNKSASYYNLSVSEFLSKIENGTINILKCNLSYDKSKITYYVLGNTGKVLMLFPVDYLNEIVNT